MGFRLLSAMCRMMRGVAGSRLKAEVNREESPCGKAVIHKFNRSGCLRFYILKKYYRITWAINVRSSSILHLIVRVILHTFFYNVAVRCLAWYKLQRRLFMHHMTIYVWFITNVRTHIMYIISLNYLEPFCFSDFHHQTENEKNSYIQYRRESREKSQLESERVN